MPATVRDAPDALRYEIHVDGELAGFAVYHLYDGVMALTHTEVDEAFSGQGLASQLIEGALADARSRNLAVEPFCPFVNRYLQKHPDQRDLVPRDEWPRFALDASS